MGDALVRILALHPDVEITSRNDAPFGVVVVGPDRRCVLDRTEQAALWHACGAAPRSGDLPPSKPEVLDLLAQRLLGEGLVGVSERPPGQVTRDQHLALAEHVELKSAFYEIVDTRENITLVSELAVLLYESCDGRRAVPELHALAQDRGYMIEVADVAKQITQLQGVGLISRGLAPRRDGNARVRLKAVIAQAPGDYGYLISADEAEILQRFRTPRLVQDLLATQQSPQDREWLFTLLSKGAAIGLLVPAEAAADNLSDEFDHDNPTEITYGALDDAGELQFPGRAAAAPARPTPQPARRITPAAVPIRQPTPAPVRPTPAPVSRQTPVPASRTSPMPALQPAQPARAPSGQMSAMQPMAPSRSTPMPIPVRPSTQTGVPEAPAPIARPSSQFATGTDNAAPTIDAAQQAKLASLSALSLDKSDGPATSTTPIRRPSGGGSSKLPWILLVLVVAGGGYYHYTTTKGNAGGTTSKGGSNDTGGSGSGSQPQITAPAGSVLLTVSAYVEAKAPIVLSSPISGRMAEVLVDAGDPVKKGQVVARLDDAGIKAKLRAAQLRQGAAAKNLASVRRLYKAQAKTMLDVSNAEAEVAVAGSDIGIIKQELEDTKIKSPIDGTVLERLVEPGESVTAGAGEAANVLKLADLSKLIAAADVNESELKNVKIGGNCDIVVDAVPGDPFKGTVKDIAQQADKTRGTVLVKVEITTDPARPLKPGQAVQVRFKAPEDPATPETPAAPDGSAAGSAAPEGSAAGSAAAAAGSGAPAAGSGAGSASTAPKTNKPAAGKAGKRGRGR